MRSNQKCSLFETFFQSRKHRGLVQGDKYSQESVLHEGIVLSDSGFVVSVYYVNFDEEPSKKPDELAVNIPTLVKAGTEKYEHLD